jgi:purine catabolism regulator
MFLTLANILNLDLLSSACIVTGEQEVSSCNVRWVTLADWKEEIETYPGELVIALDDMPNDEETILSFVQSIAGSGASALMLHISESLIPSISAIAEKGWLPIIRIPPEVSSQLVSEHLIMYMIEHAKEEFPRISSNHSWLRYMIDGASPQEFARALENHWKRALLILDAADMPITHAGEQSQQMIMTLARWRSLHPDISLPPLLPGDKLFSVSVPDTSCTIVTTYEGLMPTRKEYQMLNDALASLELSVQHYHEKMQSDQRLFSESLWNLAIGQISTESEILRSIRSIGMNAQVPVYCIVGYVETSEKEESFILTALMRATASFPLSLLGTVAKKHVIAFTTQNTSYDEIKQVINLANCYLRLYNPSLLISWGISEARIGATAYRINYREAWNTCQIGLLLNGMGKITCVEGIGIYRILHKICQEPESRSLWEQYLGRLLQLDERKSSELLKMLEIYLTSKDNVSEIARRLGLHRHTILYRLQRIEELTGCQLSDPHDRFALDLSMRLYRFHQSAGIC